MSLCKQSTAAEDRSRHPEEEERKGEQQGDNETRQTKAPHSSSNPQQQEGERSSSSSSTGTMLGRLVVLLSLVAPAAMVAGYDDRCVGGRGGRGYGGVREMRAHGFSPAFRVWRYFCTAVPKMQLPAGLSLASGVYHLCVP